MQSLFSMFNVPELNGYSEEEYRQLIRKAKLRRGDALWVIPLGFGILAATTWIGIGIGLTLGVKAFGATMTGLTLKGWSVANAFAAILIAVAAGALTRWVLIVRSIRRLVNKAGCPFCEFSLVGLPIKHGWVRCPECGNGVFLHEHRLNPDDLVPEHQNHKPIPGAGPRGAYRDPHTRRQSAAR